eukprot:7458900-Alexandrium_andersonii.AAC.1
MHQKTETETEAETETRRVRGEGHKARHRQGTRVSCYASAVVLHGTHQWILAQDYRGPLARQWCAGGGCLAQK